MAGFPGCLARAGPWRSGNAACSALCGLETMSVLVLLPRATVTTDTTTTTGTAATTDTAATTTNLLLLQLLLL